MAVDCGGHISGSLLQEEEEEEEESNSNEGIIPRGDLV